MFCIYNLETIVQPLIDPFRCFIYLFDLLINSFFNFIDSIKKHIIYDVLFQSLKVSNIVKVNYTLVNKP